MVHLIWSSDFKEKQFFVQFSSWIILTAPAGSESGVELENDFRKKHLMMEEEI